MTAVSARAIASTVVDPELPMLTLADLGVLRDVTEAGGDVTVTITPTYTGCPALAAMRDDLVYRLHDAGYAHVDVRVALSPAWSSDWISERGRRALAEAGISPPGTAGASTDSTTSVPLRLLPTRRAVRCPRCGSESAELTSEFGPTACKALYRCLDCREPFEHVKEI